MKTPKVLKAIREFFWPILEPLEPTKVKFITLEDCRFDNSEIDFELKYIEAYKKSEDERRKEVESKATIFIGTFAVAAAVLISLEKEFIFNPNLDATTANNMVVFLISLTIIYLCRAIQFAIKALQRRNYRTLGFPKLMLSDADDKKKQIFVGQYNAIKKNMEEINIKVDYMTMAQEYFKRAVATVLLLTAMFLCRFFLSAEGLLRNIRSQFQQITFSEYVVAAIMGVLLIFSIAIVFLFYKIHKLEKTK